MADDELYRGRAIAVHVDVTASALRFVATVDGVLLCERPRPPSNLPRPLRFATREAARVAAQRHVRTHEPS